MAPGEQDNPLPIDVEADVEIDGARPVHFRPLRSAEEAPIRAVYEGLGPQSRYQRFLSPMPSLPDSLVRSLASVDHVHRLAIVAEDREHDRDVIAMASYSAVDDETAEVAVAVLDQWQRHGLGTALVEALLAAAESRGYRRFAASLTAENVGMRKILHRVGEVVTSRTSYGVSELVFVRRN